MQYLENVRLYIADIFEFIFGTIAYICRPVLNERVMYSYDTRVHGVKFQGLIINLCF